MRNRLWAVFILPAPEHATMMGLVATRSEGLWFQFHERPREPEGEVLSLAALRSCQLKAIKTACLKRLAQLHAYFTLAANEHKRASEKGIPEMKRAPRKTEGFPPTYNTPQLHSSRVPVGKLLKDFEDLKFGEESLISIMLNAR